MDNKIAEVQRYFTDKLVNAEFEITSGSKYKLEVIIDSKYPFDIWIANGPDNLKVYRTGGDSFMMLPEFTHRQQILLYGKIEDEILKHTGTGYKIRTLKAQISELQLELDNLLQS